MKVTVIRKDRPPKTIAWARRRINETVRSLNFALAMSLVTKPQTALLGTECYCSVSKDYGEMTFVMEFDPRGWTRQEVEKFANYMKSSKNVVSVILTAAPRQDTMPSCDTTPNTEPLAMSATS